MNVEDILYGKFPCGNVISGASELSVSTFGQGSPRYSHSAMEF
jgi:hypothetical protein